MHISIYRINTLANGGHVDLFVGLAPNRGNATRENGYATTVRDETLLYDI